MAECSTTSEYDIEEEMMERLTKRENGHARYPRCFEEPCGGMGCLIEDCEFRVEICERLAAYEDTGLTPEDVLPKEKADEIALKLMRLADLESLCGYTRLRELAEADKDGRVVVLPCKVGQRVFALLDTDKHISECEVKQIGLGNEIGFVGIEPIGARGREYGVSIKGFGKTVFLTREEAEAALGAKSND